MVRDRVEAALGDLDTVVERDHPVRAAGHHVHVVLDHQDRHLALVAQPPDQLGDLVRLGRVHPGGRLVQQQQLRPGGQRPGDLQPPSVGVGQRVGRLVPAVPGQPLAEERQHVLGQRPGFALLAAGPRQPQYRLPRHRPGPAVGGGHHVLQHGHVHEQPQRLERARDPEPGDDVRRPARDRLCCPRLGDEPDVSRARLVHAGDHVEDRGLARAVRPDDADHLTLADLQVQLGQGAQPAERQGQPVELENGAHVATSTRRCPSSPCGRAIIITMRIAPIISCRVIDGSVTSLVSHTNAAR